MKKALVIGAAGFVGKYLVDHVQDSCMWSIAVTKLPGESFEFGCGEVRDLDIMDRMAVASLLDDVQPDYIFHLAAQSSVAMSWKDPGLTVDVNIKGTLNVLDAVRDMGGSPRLLLIGSGEEYGHVHADEIPIKEETVLRPGNLYAATKACQGMIGRIYAHAYDMDVMSVRSFNHIGPNQSPMFVVSDFCRQVAEIEAEKKDPILKVGNLKARRDFTDVRDVVRAYVLLMESGVPGETYNVGSGHAVEIRKILDWIIGLSGKEIKVEVDSQKLRPIDVPVIEADISKLTECTGWRPEIPLDRTLRETLAYWRTALGDE